MVNGEGPLRKQRREQREILLSALPSAPWRNSVPLHVPDNRAMTHPRHPRDLPRVQPMGDVQNPQFPGCEHPSSFRKGDYVLDEHMVASFTLFASGSDYKHGRTKRFSVNTTGKRYSYVGIGEDEAGE